MQKIMKIHIYTLNFIRTVFETYIKFKCMFKETFMIKPNLQTCIW